MTHYSAFDHVAGWLAFAIAAGIPVLIAAVLKGKI